MVTGFNVCSSDLGLEAKALSNAQAEEEKKESEGQQGQAPKRKRKRKAMHPKFGISFRCWQHLGSRLDSEDVLTRADANQGRDAERKRLHLAADRQQCGFWVFGVWMTEVKMWYQRYP